MVIFTRHLWQLAGRGDNLLDQFSVGHAKETANHGQIGILGVEAGDRIDLDEMRAALAVGADVNPRGVAAAQGPMGSQGDLLGLGHFRVVRPAAGQVAAELLVAALVHVGVDLGLGRRQER